MPWSDEDKHVGEYCDKYAVPGCAFYYFHLKRQLLYVELDILAIDYSLSKQTQFFQT